MTPLTQAVQNLDADRFAQLAPDYSGAKLVKTVRSVLDDMALADMDQSRARQFVQFVKTLSETVDDIKSETVKSISHVILPSSGSSERAKAPPSARTILIKALMVVDVGRTAYGANSAYQRLVDDVIVQGGYVQYIQTLYKAQEKWGRSASACQGQFKMAIKHNRLDVYQAHVLGSLSVSERVLRPKQLYLPTLAGQGEADRLDTILEAYPTHTLNDRQIRDLGEVAVEAARYKRIETTRIVIQHMPETPRQILDDIINQFQSHGEELPGFIKGRIAADTI